MQNNDPDHHQKVPHRCQSEEFSGTHLEVGTLYGALARLEEQGWIEPLESADRRRPYRLTSLGLSALQEQLNTMQQIVTTSLRRLAETSL